MAKGRVNAHHFDTIIKEIGEDVEREGLVKTPHRAAKALTELTAGYHTNLDDIVNGAVFDAEGADELVLVNNVEFYSLCEHHILPFHGHASVGYIPNDKIIGLSKIPRIVDMFARRLQIQERLTTQIADTLENLLQPKGVAVIVSAQHLCMSMRGVSKQEAYMRTSALSGVFKTKPEARAEFMRLVSLKDEV